jgi:hypothetical protein
MCQEKDKFISFALKTCTDWNVEQKGQSV